MGVVFTLINITKDFNRSENIKDIEKQIIKLKSDTDRLDDRYVKVMKNLSTLEKSLKELEISKDKISKTINQGYRRGVILFFFLRKKEGKTPPV